MEKGEIVVLGGDGFCGWPTSLHLSNLGYNITILDNLSRRKIDRELESYSVVPIQTIRTRIDKWKALTGKRISHKDIDIAADYKGLLSILGKTKPLAIVHFAEQRAAPYSMKSPIHKRYTVNNNIRATHNILCALVELGLDSHIVHLGTMGVYGYGSAGTTIPEGYIKCNLIDPITMNEHPSEIYYPSDPGSVYHMTKVMDTNLFYFYNKNDKIRITDLHQGIVWGVDTKETRMDSALANRFDYDGDYGTVLNRFLVQGAIGHPLTVYGSGEQTRAFIHIDNTMQCIQLAIENPPKYGDRVLVWNQTTEQKRLIDLARIVSKITGSEIRYYDNPRSEARKNELSACMHNIHKLGLDPVYINEETMCYICGIVRKHKDRININNIYCRSLWKPGMHIDRKGHDDASETLGHSS